MSTTQTVFNIGGAVNLEYKFALSQLERKFEAITDAVEQTMACRVEGDIIEFGTAWGATAQVIAMTLSIACPQLGRVLPKFYLADSFEGLPKATSEIDARSPHVLDGSWKPGSCKVLSRDQLVAIVRQYLPPENIVVLEGWFADTVPTIPDKTKFAIVHIDGDLYQSAIDALDGLFARDLVSDGCVILFDDWNCNRASPKFGERRAWAEMVEKHKIVSSDCGDYAHMCHKVIVHR